ncbi:hypothetical protein MAPG_07987, partial [Magnaporthiopsis poae ATCC 64411]
MPAKRKRDILDFDVNKSDSDDENFEPGLEREEKPRRGAGKRSRPTKGRAPVRRRDRYGGSDIDDDDDDIIEDSEPDYLDDDDDDDDEDAPVNATGRRMRKAAAQQHNYKETSEEDEADTPPADEDNDEDDDELTHKKKKQNQRASRPSRIVTLKTDPKILRSARAQNMEPPTPGVSTRRTRARTEEAEEFVELSASGKHARSTRAGTRSKSPEALSRNARTTKGLKGLKKLPPPIEEVTQESSVPDPPQPEELTPPRAEGDSSGDNEGGQPGVDSVQDSGVETAGDGSGSGDADAVQGSEGEAEDVMESAEAVAAADEADEADDDDDDDDDAPVTRRTRASRAVNAAREADEEPEEASENAAPGRRLTRRSLRPKKSTQEPSSDFDPGEDDDSGEGEGSTWDGSARKRARAEQQDDGDEDYSGQPSRGRRTSQAKRTKKRVGKDSGDEEVELNQDEMLEELEELRQSSRSRRRRRSPSIAYEQPLPKRRRVAVDYSIKPLDQLMDQEEEEDAAPTPAKGRRGGRAGASTTWQRSFAATYGPFGGGGGAGSLLGGPWGTGATGGVEEDSSDDEAAAVARAGAGGAVGMTPTTATAPGFGQAGGGLDGAGGVTATPNLGKVKNQKAFADADPLGVDLTVDFSKVGGLQGHIDQLKEMIMLPLLYPELFLKYKVTPPRGVLFHGPPGTGKTLLARALSNAVGIGGRKITFYMRKGADALSKWVGEAEKQLRLLFEEARRTQPSIIFFDEIDGLAPVRSSKQEQIHASIVSTLLALMDGMDGRGQVIVIGATNRPDSV